VSPTPSRSGPILLLAGVAVVAAGLFLNAVGAYWLTTNIRSIGFGTSGFRSYTQELVGSYILIGVGVILVGLGWAWTQRVQSSLGSTIAYRWSFSEIIGIVLVLVGSCVFAGWWLFIGAVEWAALYGVNLHLPNWLVVLEGAFTGLGVALWGSGWFIYRRWGNGTRLS